MKILAALFALAVSVQAAAPQITALTADPVTAGSTQLKATVNVGGLPTTLTFFYGPKDPGADAILGTPSQLIVNLSSTTDSTQAQPVTLNNLRGNQEYAYFATVSNSDGDDREPGSGVQTFFVPAYQPTVVRLDPLVPAITDGGDANVTLRASVTPNGADVTDVRFEYGTTTSYGRTAFATGMPILGSAGATTVTAQLPTLPRGTVFQYRIVAVNALGNGTTTNFSFTTPANRAPIARNDSVKLKGTTPVTIPVLRNDRDPDGDSLVIASVTQGTQGTVRIEGDSLVYTPRDDAEAGDSFTYTVRDDYENPDTTGADFKSSTATVTINAPGLKSKGLHAAELKDAEGNVVGSVRLVGTGSGSVSGKVQLYSKSYAVQGQLDANGHFYFTIPTGDDSLQLKVDFGGDDDTDFSASLKGNDEEYTATAAANTLTDKRRDEIVGKYTVEFPGASSSEDGFPQGTGFAKFDVKPWGEVSMKGRLGDGTKFSAKGALTGTNEVGRVTFWTTPDQNRVSGSFDFGGTGTTTVTGSMKWYRQPDRSAEFFPNGFYAELTPNGSRFEPPQKGDRALDGASKATLSLRSSRTSKSARATGSTSSTRTRTA
jgi:hypothetical protein